MSEEAVKQAESAEETEAKPTITVAEKESEPAAEIAPTAEAESAAEAAPVEPEDIHYQAVEKEGSVTAIWEMQGQKHMRTIDPRSVEGKQILALFETAA